MLKKVGFSFWAEKLLVKCSSTLDKEYYMFISDYINVHNIQLSEQMNFTKFLIDIFTNKTRGRDSSDEKIELVLYGYAIEALILSIEYYQRDLRSIIESLDVDKVKPPIGDLVGYYYYLSISNLPIEEVCSILGKVIGLYRKF